VPVDVDGVVEEVVDDVVEVDVVEVDVVVDVAETFLVVGVVEMFATFTTRCPVVVPISPVARTRAPFA
tara:strand:- start:10 stop:213 length:204 start_codon:yes stop_codon:yes gene_type:complete